MIVAINIQTFYFSFSPNQFSNYVKNKKAAAGMADQYGSSSPGTFKMGAEGMKCHVDVIGICNGCRFIALLLLL